MRLLLSLLCLALIGACTTNPTTGREQIVAMPAVQLAYADMDFALMSEAQRFSVAMQCTQDCEGVASADETTARIEALRARLEAAARDIAPDCFERIERFSIEIDANPGMRTGSNASGRIVLSAGLAGQKSADIGTGAVIRREIMPDLGGLDSTDIRLAFLVAREMGHVIARHAEENSGASLVASALGLLIPGVSVIARFVASRIGAGAVRDSWASDQQSEADEIALSLLSQAGLSPLFISLALQGGARPLEDSTDGWDMSYLKSMQRIAQLAVAPLRYSAFTVTAGATIGSFSRVAEGHFAAYLANGGGGEGSMVQCESGTPGANGNVAPRPI